MLPQLVAAPSQMVPVGKAVPSLFTMVICPFVPVFATLPAGFHVPDGKVMPPVPALGSPPHVTVDDPDARRPNQIVVPSADRMKKAVSPTPGVVVGQSA